MRGILTNHGRRVLTILVITVLLAFDAEVTSAQWVDSTLTGECPQKDISDLLRSKNKPPRVQKKITILVLPSVSANPSNGVLLGLAGPVGWYFGKKETTRVSGAAVNLSWTTKNQLISFIKTNIYTLNNKFFLQGDWRYYIYSQPTFGLGTNAPDTARIPMGFTWQGIPVDESIGSFQMLFNYVKLHEIISYELKENLYAGIGYHFDYYYSIRDEDLRLTGDTLTLTPHYYYSKEYGFDTAAYMLSGISANFVYDTRDNLVNPYKGYFVNVNYRYNLKGLGSEQNSSTLWVEFRTYVGLSKTTSRHLLAFWLFGNFTVNGQVPYLDLFALGDDQRSRSGRGYLQGRYRGDKFIYGEAEYRFPISSCSKILGGVVFVNACTASNPITGVRLFNYIRPAVGAGLRIMVNKYFRTNINIDFSIGLESNGLYFSGQEAF